MRGPAGALDAGVGAEEEGELVRVADRRIHHCAGRAVAGAVAVPLVLAEQAGVVALLHDHEGHAGVVAAVPERFEGLAQQRELVAEDDLELA